MRHHLRFKNIHPAIVGAAERVFGEAPWEASSERQIEVGDRFLLSVHRAYGVSQPQFRMTQHMPMGSYSPARRSEDSLGFVSTETPARISLTHWNSLDLFVFARHHVLNERGEESPLEDDALAWGCSLFYRVRPRAFRSLAREGRVLGVTARDTYTSESWATLEMLGATDGDWLADDITPEDANLLLGSLPAEDDNEPAIVPPQDTAHEFAESPFSADSDDQPDKTLEEMNRDEVRALAVELGIPRQGRNKTELIAAIREAN